MKINANSIRPGNIIEHKSKLWSVAKIQHTQPGKGGAYIQVEMKDVQSGTKLNERFRSEENVEKVRVDQQEYQYLYDEGDKLAVMDNESYEQTTLDKEILGEAIQFLQDNMTITVDMFDGRPVLAHLPENVVLVVEETEAVVKGQTAASSFKPAIMDNGSRVMVPPFINVGDKIVVRTEDGSYIERSKG